MDSPEKNEGAWIFLSHSNKDFEKVREIRNFLENRGHKPLMFFLKCLESDDARLPALLKEEIAARTWFVLCDSPNAQASKYVQAEMAMIQAMEGKVFRRVDLTKNLETELPKVVEVSKRATVFLSYAAKDRKIAERICRALSEQDYGLAFNDDSASLAGADLGATIDAAIDNAIAHGFVLVLLSATSVSSKWCRAETEYALNRAAQSNRSNVVPVVITPFAPGTLPLQLASLQYFDLTTGPFDQRVKELIDNLKTRAME